MKTLVAIFVFVFSVAIVAAEPDPLFRSADTLNITLSGPFAQIDREREKDKEYQGASLSYTDSTGNEVVLDVTLEVRGNNRLKKEICRYSQLWVRFDRDQARGTLFDGQRRLKMVVQCQSSARYEAYLLKELQAYQFFNQISDYSFATRRLQVNYQGSESSRRNREHLAFFIEHDRRLARRFDAEEVNDNRISPTDLNPAQASKVALFMYMLGNTDFSMSIAPEGSCCHNTKLILKEGEYFPIPYDFDSSGYVDTEYAVPNAALPLRNNRQRLYRGYCTEPELLTETVGQFQSLQSQIYATAGAAEQLRARDKRRSASYLDDFYEIINDPRRLDSQITSACLGEILQ